MATEKLRDEIADAIRQLGKEKVAQIIFGDLSIGGRQGTEIVTSLGSGHHLLLAGPPGCGKTTIANKLTALLGEIEVVEDCPLNCSPDEASCPWCLERRRQGYELRSQILPANMRVKRVQGSGELAPEDLIGDLDPEAAFSYGIHSLKAFVPGKLLRANRGILLIDFIDRVPERTLNTILYALQGETITIGAYEESFPLDILVVATGSEETPQLLPLDLVDNFDVIYLDYVNDFDFERQMLNNEVGRGQETGTLTTDIDKVIEVVNKTRSHSEVQRGVSTRGMLKCAELLSSFNRFKGDEEEALHPVSLVTLPHRLKLSPESDSIGKREQIIGDIVDEVIGKKETNREDFSFSKEDLMELVEEIAKEEKVVKPLKYGALDLLLKRIWRFPESKLARMHREVMQRLQELYPERYGYDNITEEILKDIEQSRKEQEELKRLAGELGADALTKTIDILEYHDVLERDRTGWWLSQKGITLLLERLAPKFQGNTYVTGYGKHGTGKKLSLGEGKIIGFRRFRFGDRYRDISFPQTIRQIIRNRSQEVSRKDIMVATKDIRSKLDIVLVVDLSGTMHQMEKLWYAKQSAIVLSLAAARYGDRVGVISFSNLGDIVVGLTDNPYRVTRQILDLELHENAFTNIGYGLFKAYELFSHYRRKRALQHVILISDGDATAPHPSPQKYALRQAGRIARKGITISCVCISGESTDPELMGKIAKIGKGNMYLIGPEELATTLEQEMIQAPV